MLLGVLLLFFFCKKKLDHLTTSQALAQSLLCHMQLIKLIESLHKLNGAGYITTID